MMIYMVWEFWATGLGKNLMKRKFIERMTDRHGKKRIYFRRGHGRRYALPEIGDENDPSPEFVEAYQNALSASGTYHSSLSKQQTEAIRRIDRIHRFREAVGTIYAIGFDRWIKIGFSSDHKTRVSNLKTAIPVEPKLLGTMKGSRLTERSLHERFKSYSTRGEWFELRGEVLDWVNGLSHQPCNKQGTQPKSP